MRDDEIKPANSAAPEKKIKNIGAIALWGVPNSGKSTFVKRLLGKAPDEQKIQTTNITPYPNLEFDSNGRNYKIEVIYDMPGVVSRKSEWLNHVKKAKNSIYLVNLEKFFVPGDEYRREVRQHLKELKEVLGESGVENLIVVGTHLDKTTFSDSVESNNLIQQSREFHAILEVFQSIWFYSVNLMDGDSCRKLISSIVGDIDAKY